MESVSLIILVILALIVANGFFSMSEIAVVSARPTRLQRRASEGKAGAQAALELIKAPSRFLSTIQLWITLAGILAGALGGARLSGHVAAVLGTVGVPERLGAPISVAAVVGSITYVSLVLGELFPKRIALVAPEGIASYVAPLLQQLARLASPLVWLLAVSTDALAKIFGIRRNGEPSMTAEEINLVIQRGIKTGVFDPVQRDLIDRVLRFADRSAAAVMTPYPDLVWLDVDESEDEIREKLSTSGHSQFPVLQGGRENVRGVVYTKDLLTRCYQAAPLDVAAVLRSPLLIPESMRAMELSDRFREEKSAVALVIDEFGSLTGIVTASDMLEAFVGELSATEHSIDLDVVRRKDGSMLIDGALPIDELLVLLGGRGLPDDPERQYDTIGGFVMAQLGRIPAAGDSFTYEGTQYEVMDMDRHRVDKVLVIPPPQATIETPDGKDE